MRTKAVVSILFCFTTVVGGLVVPLLGFTTNHIPSVERGVSITIQLGTPSEPPPPASLPGTLPPQPFIPPSIGNLVLRGFGPSGSFLTVKRDKIVSATARVGEAGTFDILLASLSENVYEITLWVEDRDGNISQSVVLPSIPVFKDATTTIENIFIPPTLLLVSRRIVGSQDIVLRGFSAPNSNVILYFSPVSLIKTISTSSSGRWEFILKAGELSQGKYKVRAQTQLGSGLFSGFSEELDLEIILPPFFPPDELLPPGEIPSGPDKIPADFNDDEKIDLIDLSILLYNWGVPQDTRVDLNHDAVVDLVDFSVLLFWWTP